MEQTKKGASLVTIGVPAYNEKGNIGQLMESIITQEAGDFLELIVIISGCNDGSEVIVQEYAQKDSRIRCLKQEKRWGKASAINLLLKEARGDIIVLSSADVVWERDCLRNLLMPLETEEVGMSGVWTSPRQQPGGIVALFNLMIWRLHHELNLISPKLGETIALKKVVESIPFDCATDEVYLENIVLKRGFRLHYAKNARVYNSCPLTLKALFWQRMRIFWGHLDIKRKYHYTASSMYGILVMRAVMRYLLKKPGMFIPLAALGMMEAAARLGAVTQCCIFGRPPPFIWPCYRKY